jgi:hypothetical protein
MRQKTNEFLRRIQSVRPEVKKTFRRGASNAPSMLKEKFFFLIKILFSRRISWCGMNFSFFMKIICDSAFFFKLITG